MFRRIVTATALVLAAAAPLSGASAQVAGNGTLNGLAYFDLAKGLSDTNKEMMTFAFRRIYFQYDMNMSDNVSGRFRTDVAQDADGKVRLYMKHAYANWNVSDQFNLRAGQQATLLFDDLEGVWGYRSVAKTMEDQFKVRSSADFGLTGAFKPNDMVTVKAMFSNGNGYDKADDSATRKSIDVQGSIRPNSNLMVNIYYGMNGYDNDGDPTTSADQDNTTTIDLGAGYTAGPLAVGGSYATVDNASFTDGLKASGMWVFGHYMLSDMMTVMGAYQRFDPDTDTSDDETAYIILGLDYMPQKGLSIIPNIQSMKTGTADAVNTFLLTFYWKW